MLLTFHHHFHLSVKFATSCPFSIELQQAAREFSIKNMQIIIPSMDGDEHFGWKWQKGPYIRVLNGSHHYSWMCSNVKFLVNNLFTPTLRLTMSHGQQKPFMLTFQNFIKMMMNDVCLHNSKCTFYISRVTDPHSQWQCKREFT